MAQLPSNYNFVPVPDKPIYPTWADQVSHDVPFEDGVCGTIEVELKAESPLFTRASGQAKDGLQKPYTDQKGKPAIPGTSLRGMLRSVVEIATFGKLGPINDHTYGLRDLHIRHLYGDFMADVQRREDNNNREPMPLVNSGWLYFTEDESGEKRYFIKPCNFAKVEYAVIQKFIKAMNANFDPNDRQSAAKKYRAWGDNLTKAFNVPVKLLLREGTESARKGIKRISDYGEVKGGGVKHAGQFVFTGQPQGRRIGEKRKKHHDFFFYGEKNGFQDLEVTKEQFDTFQRVHSDGAEQHAHEISPNEEWGFWRTKLRAHGAVDLSKEGANKQAVPVFFIIEKRFKNNQPVLRSFGLAMMFRLAYDQSLNDLRQRTQPSYSDDKQDMAELMFGHVRQDEKSGEDTQDPMRTLRGRISIGQGRVVGEAPLAKSVRAVLSAPKPTYYPAYVSQQGKPGSNPLPQSNSRGYAWTAYMSEQSPKLRGWKRYLVRNEQVKNPPLPEKASAKVFTEFQPLREGATFRFKIRVHNLKQVELGALLWSLTFGEAPGACHLLGMARALGYGKCTLRVIDQELVSNKDIEQHPLPQSYMAESVTAFRKYMNNETGGKWASSSTINELIICATPHPSGRDPDHLRAPLLNHPQLRNEFAHYKKQGKALPLHSSDLAYRKTMELISEREKSV